MFGGTYLVAYFLFNFIIIEGYFVQVELYENGNCGGTSRRDDLDFLCYSYPSFGYEISGAFMTIGSCLKLHKNIECGGETFILGFPEYDLCNLPCCGWNDHVLSVEDCDTQEVNVLCPNGTYIREIEFGDKNQGWTIHCYKPTENVTSYSQNTHGSPPSLPSNPTNCPVAAHGLSDWFDMEWQAHYDPNLVCDWSEKSIERPRTNYSNIMKKIRSPSPLQSDGGVTKKKKSHLKGSILPSEPCGTVHEAVNGVRVLIDEAGVIKEAGYYCTQVADPTTMCEPQESLRIVVECNNLESGNELECGYSQTIGVGEARTMTGTERIEMTFSAEFGYTIGSTIYGLSASMSATLGYSELVGYEWSQSDTTTWSQETTISAIIKVRPYTYSRLEQLSGKCSFYGTSVNYFKQTDVDVDGMEMVSHFVV